MVKSGETIINILQRSINFGKIFRPTHFNLAIKLLIKKETFDELKANNEQLSEELYIKLQNLLNAIVDQVPVQEEAKPDVQIKHRMVIFGRT